jgi:hypothetical protein
MNMDTELEVWRSQWQSETAVPPDLRRKVERQSRAMKIARIAEVLVTIVIGGGTAAWAVRAPQREIVLLAVWTWILIACAWTFSLRVNRGNWYPSADDAAAFVDLSVRRCRAKLTAIRFSAGFFVVQISFCLNWVYNNSPARGRPVLRWLLFSSVPIDVVWFCTVAFFGFLIWYRRKTQGELAYLRSLQEHGPDRFS